MSNTQELFYKITNDATKQVDVYFGTDTDKANKKGYVDKGLVEQESVGNWYLATFAPKPTLEKLKLVKLGEINIEYEKEATAVKFGTPESEVLTWDIQKLEAEAWKKDNTVATPFITELAIVRGVPRDTLLEKVLEKVSAFNIYMAQLTGKRQRKEDEIKAAQTPEDLEVVVW